MPNKNPNAHEPAHPVQNARLYDYCGLTKREHIAALAMQGLLANQTLIAQLDGASNPYVAKMALNMADALIAELEQ